MKSSAFISALVLMAFTGLASAQPPDTYSHPAYGHSPQANRFVKHTGMRFERYRDQEGYHLRIQTRGMDPESLQVSIQGRSLVVENRESHRVERSSERGSYQFASSSSSMRRRFPLPPDADAQAMQRSVEEDVLLISLPYRQASRY